MAEEQEEDIVSATQTELAFLLVFVFVSLLGFYASTDDKAPSDSDKSAGTGKAMQGLPKGMGGGAASDIETANIPPPKKPVSPLDGPFDSRGPDVIAALKTGGGKSGNPTPPEKKSACLLSIEVSPSRTTVLSEGQGWSPSLEYESCQHRATQEEAEDRLLSAGCMAGGDKAACEAGIAAQQQLYFMLGRSEITQFGRMCLKELCTAVYDKYAAGTGQFRQIVIEGHTSSEWKPGAVCTAAKASAIKAPKYTAHQCNLALSTSRALAIFEECWKVLSVERKLDFETYQGLFAPVGRGSLDARRDKTGCEKRRESRRVEFVFVDKDPKPKVVDAKLER